MALRLEIIIHEVMSRPYLFNKFHEDYQDGHKRQRGFDEIATQVNNFIISVDRNAELLNGKNIECLWNQLLNDYKEARKQMNSQRSGDGLKIIHFSYMREMSFMDPYLQQKQVLSSLNQSNRLKRKKVLQAPQSTQKKKVDPIEKNCAIKRINSQMENILNAFQANLSGTPADPRNSAQSSTAAPAYYPFNAALPSTSGEAASTYSHPLNPAMPSTSAATRDYYSFHSAVPSTSQEVASHCPNRTVPSTSAATPDYYSFHSAVPSTSQEVASHCPNRTVPLSSAAAPDYYFINPAVPSTSEEASSGSSHPLNRAVPFSSSVAPTYSLINCQPSTSRNAVSAPTYLNAVPSTSGRPAVPSTSTANDTAGLDVSIRNNLSNPSSDYSNILWESFQKVPAGQELNCFKHVLKDFLQFRRTLKKE
ncbi:mucin-5AC-like isoform X1 [Trichogramma pretiosum]|uniref:mucin-5AC-like isoform X1 n=1 Tax=Trichogramma pretiosum TaxID=7493 RepID=UPI000C71AFCB|nr:mucin-5AC-like isoform X1 [Trichogramma pretiosum]